MHDRTANQRANCPRRGAVALTSLQVCQESERDLPTRKLRALPESGESPAAALYRTMAEFSPGLLWTFRPDGGIEGVNARVTEYSGRSEAELRGLGWHKTVHPQDLPYGIQRWKAAIARGEPFEVQFRLRRADGEYRWHLVAARPVQDAAGRILRWVGSGTDIEDQLHAARVLASRGEGGDAAERLRSIMTLTSDFYWETDTEHRFTVLETGGRFGTVMFVATRIGKTRWEVPSLLPDAAGWRAHRETLRTRKPFRDFETARRGDDGVVHHYSIDGEPVFDGKGRFTGYRGVGRETTSRKLAEHALSRSAGRLRAFLERMPAIAWIKDSRLRYAWVSKGYERMLGKTLAQLQGRHNSEIWPEALALRHRHADESVLRRDSPVQMVSRIPRADGSIARLLVVKFPLADQTGASGIAGIGFEIAADEAMARPREDSLERLSDRELQVLRLIVDGFTSADVAAQLSLSPKSVDTYRSRVMAKLQISDLPGLVKFAIRQGLTSAK
ncbi:MAG: PAS domain S-box protein [Betaproteobacteria bacterium]